MSTSRGIRNCNPLNIRRNSTKWQGLRTEQTDSAFFQFISMPYGYRAAIRTLVTYYNKYGLKTIRGIVSRWAPPSENNTENYINVVAKRSGFSPDVEIDIYDADTMIAIVSAMSFVENGVEADENEVRQGYLLAFAS
ncbi:structural protein P5 [Bacteroides sp. 41_26]|uniref:structural protein P5 n=1 Tax=Bacteroides sp. 41_26 TaxID=1896973 RepID=UPI00259C7998|nr:structural protein P5 [Bacteroides sp. 41_26]